jgi:hypothetical protein
VAPINRFLSYSFAVTQTSPDRPITDPEKHTIERKKNSGDNFFPINTRFHTPSSLVEKDVEKNSREEKCYLWGITTRKLLCGPHSSTLFLD